MYLDASRCGALKTLPAQLSVHGLPLRQSPASGGRGEPNAAETRSTAAWPQSAHRGLERSTQGITVLETALPALHEGPHRIQGDHGLAVIEHAPFGVIGAITPVTHSLPTVTGNAMSMIDAGKRGARGAIRGWLMILFALVMVMIAVAGLVALVLLTLGVVLYATGAPSPSR